MRIVMLMLFTFTGCAKGAAQAPEPAHAAPEVSPVHEGIAIKAPGELQIRPERAVLLSNEQAAQLAGVTRELYLRGYQLKDGSPGEAVVLFERVIAMTEAGDPYHQKAQAQLAKLQPVDPTHFEMVR